MLKVSLTLSRLRYRDLDLEVFHDAVKALAHVCDHILTTPETAIWMFHVPAMIQHIGAGGRADRERFAGKLWAYPTPGAAQTVYDEYVAEIGRSFARAWDQGMYWEESTPAGTARMFIGPSGLIIICHRSEIPSAFFYANAQTSYVRDYSIERRRLNPLPREPQRGADTDYESGVKVPDGAEPYRVFRRGIMLVRREFIAAYNIVGPDAPRVSGTKQWVNLCNQPPKYADWVRMCQTAPSSDVKIVAESRSSSV